MAVAVVVFLMAVVAVFPQNDGSDCGSTAMSANPVPQK
jgi:hypothetical protein